MWKDEIVVIPIELKIYFENHISRKNYSAYMMLLML